MECALCKIKDQKFRVIKETNFSLVCVNLRPLLEGHIMVLPKRHIESYTECNENEAKDLFNLCHEMNIKLREVYKKDGALSAFNHGNASSQKHIHIHIIPLAGEKSLRHLISETFKVPLEMEASKEELERRKNEIVRELC